MNTITEVTRREIIDFLSMGDHSWHGRLGERDFLGKIFDLKALPSTDHRPRFKNAAVSVRRTPLPYGPAGAA
jgi:AbiJ-like protein